MLQAHYKSRSGSGDGYTSVFSIMRRHGVGALFRGLEAKLLQTVLTSALMFVTYEFISDAVFQLFDVGSTQVAPIKKQWVDAATNYFTKSFSVV